MSQNLQKWGANLGINLIAAQELVKCADMAVRAQVREHNTGDSAETLCRVFEREAAKHDITVRWDDGLFPVLLKNGKEYHLPDEE